MDSAKWGSVNWVSVKSPDTPKDKRHITFSPCRIVDNCLVAKEILKMFMNQISSLKSMTYYTDYSSFNPSDISFINFPGARDWFKVT